MEKILKALFVKIKNELAPKSHNLFMLCESAGITVDEKQEILFGILMKYQIQGRYPEHDSLNMKYNDAIKHLNDAREVLKWLQRML